MKYVRKLLGVVLLLCSELSLSCPAGHYEMCVLPRPWGGCAQKACIPDSGTMVEGVSGSLADLNQGILRLGNELVRMPVNVTEKIGDINLKIDVRETVQTAFLTSAIINGAACIASGGTAWGQAYADHSGAIYALCGANACGCALISLAAAGKVAESAGPEEKKKIEAIFNSPTMESYLTGSGVNDELNQEIASSGLSK